MKLNKPCRLTALVSIVSERHGPQNAQGLPAVSRLSLRSEVAVIDEARHAMQTDGVGVYRIRNPTATKAYGDPFIPKDHKITGPALPRYFGAIDSITQILIF